ELVPLVTVQNLARALTEMNDQGFMTVGLDSAGNENLRAVALRQPLALVLGAEGKGLRQLTRETCSVVARLDMPGEIKSLNVSNAAVLALYIGASRLGLVEGGFLRRKRVKTRRSSSVLIQHESARSREANGRQSREASVRSVVA